MINNSEAVNSPNKYKHQNKRVEKKSSLNISLWLKNHNLACIDSFRTLYQAPLSNLLTVFILGVAMALPILLYLVILNFNNNISAWQNDLYQYSIYLDSKYNQSKAINIQSEISKWPEIASIKIISKEEGFAELKNIMGLDDVLDNIDYNPLPVVLSIKIKPEYQNINIIKELLERSSNISGVDKSQADIVWLEKINKLLNLSSAMVYIFSLALGLAVLLVIANTIRLVLQNKQQEMTVYALLGATTAYIRRPYLYGGFFYGLLAGIVAISLANILFNKLYNLIFELGFTGLINNNLIGLGISNIFAFLLFSSFLGWLGARISLYWQIKNLQVRLSEI